ncbi:Capsule biosynthesis protein capA [hydrothermal vent metagenome]|uniref:Capsule biosynthesis protein capA n=1 Tax=hydrothermal vent metagenome TaxID=652676 RepID=A0A1W1CMG1_9ZZZZ
MKLSFFGDTVLDKAYKIDFEIDKFIFNLESPLSCKGTPALFKVNICQDSSYIADTFKTIPLAVSLANNHIMDFGEEAFAKTKASLEIQSIPFFGAGLKGENFNNPSIIKFADKKIGLCGYSCVSTHPVFGDDNSNGSAILALESMILDIELLKLEVDFIVVQPHWGIQEIPFPRFSDREIAHSLIDAGADIIIGHHAHVIQSHEIYRGKHIFYGLGNFIFPDLDVPTRYDGEKFTARRIKKQEIEHRRSMVITLDENLKVDFFTVVLDNGVVKKSNFPIPKWLPSSESSFRRKLSFYNKKAMLKRFIRNPKLPNFGHFKSLFSSPDTNF